MLLQQLIHRIPSPEEKMNPRMRNTIFIILLTLFTSTVGATTIKIYTQQDFDLLSTNIMKAIKQGKKNISVDIETKELRFSDNQISITGIKRRDVSISIHGNGVRIMSRGISVKEVKSPTFMYLRNGDYYNPWTEFQQLQDTISIIDEALHQYGENAVEKKEDIKFGSNTFQHTFFDEGYGSSQVLALPLKEIGAMRIDVRTYPLTDKDVKAILKSHYLG